MSHRVSALALLALAALGACSDPSAPEGARPTATPRHDATSAETTGLPHLETAFSGKPDQGPFNITLKFLVAPTAQQRLAFETAAARWERVIVRDVPSITGRVPSCLSASLPPASTGVVDDIVIEVLLRPIDGPGKVLGAAGPCYIRNVDRLPVSGVMYFDSDDIAAIDRVGLLDEVVVHEMGHVLGIGSLWNLGRTLLQGIGADPYFAGRLATSLWRSEGGLGFLPVENTGGQGTALGHWRESVLGNELMTGWIGLGENPLSRITAASLADLGYGVSMLGEAFALGRGTPGVTPAPSTTETVTAEGVHIAGGEQVLAPIGVVLEATAP